MIPQNYVQGAQQAMPIEDPGEITSLTSLLEKEAHALQEKVTWLEEKLMPVLNQNRERIPPPSERVETTTKLGSTLEGILAILVNTRIRLANLSQEVDL